MVEDPIEIGMVKFCVMNSNILKDSLPEVTRVCKPATTYGLPSLGSFNFHMLNLSYVKKLCISVFSLSVKSRESLSYK